MHRLHLKTIFYIFLLLLDRTCECQFSYREPWLQKQKLQEKQEPRLSLPKENKKLLFISKKLLLFWKNPHQHFSLDIYRYRNHEVFLGNENVFFFQTLNAISTEQSSTIVFPFPIDTLCLSLGNEKEETKRKSD